jgi:hypothetical protein
MRLLVVGRGAAGPTLKVWKCTAGLVVDVQAAFDSNGGGGLQSNLDPLKAIKA